MKTKEEILDEHSVTASGANMIPPYREDILDAMEEYANQSKIPIDFSEWIAENRYHRFEVAETVGTDKVEYRWTDSEYQDEYTIEQLYEKFKSESIQSPQKPK